MLSQFLIILYIFLYYSVQISGCEEGINNVISVVLFFADSGNVPKDHNGLECLGLTQITTVPVLKLSEGEKRPTNHRRNVPDCEGFLQSSLNSLTHFCQTAFGMKTALISVKSKKIVNEISNAPQVPPPEVKESKILRSRDLNPYAFAMLHKIPQNHAEDTIPAYDNFNKNLKDLVIGPQHTEVFKIRVKRDEMETEQPREIVDFPVEKTNDKQPWDVLDIMSHIRYSFFGKLFQKESDSKHMKENKETLNNIGKPELDPGLFQTVSSTLSTLQEDSDPFLMIVFGGQLSEIKDHHSPLIQSLKHIMESTVPEKTLLVLTGSCPTGKDDVLIINENVDNKNVHVPIFAKGPKSDKLSSCHVLYDIPLIVRNLLEELSPNSKIPDQINIGN